MKQRLLLFFIFFLLATFVLAPWPSSVSQDDAVYVDTVLRILEGNFSPHPLTLAALWPQALAGSGAVAVFGSWIKPISLLNLLTWLTFGGMIFLVLRHLSLPTLATLSFFSFPVWFQYGASFLTDIYSALLLLAVILFSKRLTTKGLSFWGILLLGLSVIALILERQMLALFPFAWGFFSGLRTHGPGTAENSRRVRQVSSLLMILALVGVGLYFLLPLGLLQKNFVALRILEFQKNGIPYLRLVIWFVEFILGLGLFMLPLLDFKRLPKRELMATLMLQILSALALHMAQVPHIGAGVLFVDYLPHIIGSLFYSFGVWGLLSLRTLFRNSSSDWFSPLSSLLTILALILFSLFLGSADIRYVLVLTIPLLYHLSQRELFANSRPIGDSYFYLAPMLALSLLVNRYNLETTSQRWKASEDLQARGALPLEISAGYGRDLFIWGRSCAEAAEEKILKIQSENNLSSQQLLEIRHRRLYLTAPRVFEDGWSPIYLVKPTKFFLKTLSARGVNAELTPLRVYDYSILGLTSQITIFKKTEYKAPWCFNEENP